LGSLIEATVWPTAKNSIDVNHWHHSFGLLLLPVHWEHPSTSGTGSAHAKREHINAQIALSSPNPVDPCFLVASTTQRGVADVLEKLNILKVMNFWSVSRL